MNQCKKCKQKAELAYYKNQLMCINCAKDEMIKDGSVRREILKHGAKHE